MVLGVNQFGLSVFGGPDDLDLEAWFELCKPDTQWVEIPPDNVSIKRCVDDAN